MLASNGEILIDATQITNPGIHKIWHPDVVVDEDDNIHVVWTDKSGDTQNHVYGSQPTRYNRSMANHRLTVQ